MFVRPFNIIRRVCHIDKAPNATLIARWREENDSGVRTTNSQLDPSLLFVEWLIGKDRHTEFFSVEFKSAILIFDRDADKLDRLKHKTLLICDNFSKMILHELMSNDERK